MNVKMIVKVMNFHALLRVEASRRRAEKYFRLEREVAELIGIILNNRNFILDKHTLRPDPAKPALQIYIGSDLGFCGSINAAMNGMLAADADGEKVLIGKKLRSGCAGELLRMTREQFAADSRPLENLLGQSVASLSHAQIIVCYNHYHKVGSIEPTKKQIFPLEQTAHRPDSIEDFEVEGDVNELLTNLVRSYLNYQIQIAAVNSYAAENIMRQNATSDSLKKLADRETEAMMEERRERVQKEFRKVIDSYIKIKGFGGDCA